MTLVAALLVISFFAPVIESGTRHIYLGDLYTWALFLPGLVWFFRGSNVVPPVKARAVRALVACAGAMLVVYGHGYFRPLFVDAFHRTGIFVPRSSEFFQPARELVVLFRFWSWFAAAFLLALSCGQASLGKRLRTGYEGVLKTLVLCLALEAVLMGIAHLNLGFHNFLGTVYKYNIHYDIWVGREYGSFPSPVEAGVTMGFAGLLVLASGALSTAWTAVAVLAALCGLALTRTATATAALVIAGIFVVAGKRLRLYPWRIFLVGAGILLCLVVGLRLFAPVLFDQKMYDIVWRLVPWRAQLSLLFSRPDFAALGLGFVDFAADSMPLFIMTRGGLAGLGVVAWFVARLLLRNWGGWVWRERAPIIFLAFASVLFDVLIYRNVVCLVLAVAIPMLAFNRRK